MHRVLLVGAGKIGSVIAQKLADSGDFDLLVGDANEAALERLRPSQIPVVQLDVSSPQDLHRAMEGRDSVVSACTCEANLTIAKAAAKAGASYFDLTEDVTTAHSVQKMAQEAAPGQIFMPQCGLAPGFVSIAAHDLCSRFERLDTVRLRVGALPQFPSNEMMYNLTWSTDGLINEYGNPCEAIYEGAKIEVLPLEGLEHFSLEGVDYEAFNTSGGLGTLCDTLQGRVRNLDYKTIRYPGHRNLMAFLMNELRLNSRRALLKDILDNAVPITLQDVVLVFITVTGWQGGRLMQITDTRKIYPDALWSAIQITTASSLCAVLDLHRQGKLPRQGFVRQEQVPLSEFLSNRFGRAYAS